MRACTRRARTPARKPRPRTCARSSPGAAACSTVADDAVLAHPASLGSVPTNANNQDVVGMGTVAVRHARRLLDNARRVVAIELLAAAEAVDLVGREDLGAGTRAVYGRVRERVPPLLEDRPLGADVERLAGALGRVAG